MAGISGSIAGSSSNEAVSIIGESGVFGRESAGGVCCEDGEACKAADGGGKAVSPDWEEGRGRSC